MGWNKLKGLFVVQEGQPAAISADDHAAVEAELAKYQVPASEAPARLPADTRPSQLSGSIDFQALYDQAGIPNTDEVEALEKFLAGLDVELPQASKLSSAKAFLGAIGKSANDVLTDAGRKIRVVRAVEESKTDTSRSAIQQEQQAIDDLQKQIDDRRAAIEAAKRDLDSVKAQCTSEEGRLQGARMFFGAMDKLASDVPPPTPAKSKR
ncbi:MAG: hypothetical protein JWO36_2986 [Myxococcales bacterium]|nr:hypothetical protein [Myxococcales bacterium]